MDPLPFVPSSIDHLDIFPGGLEVLQTSFCAPIYPRNVAENLVKHSDTNLNFGQNASAAIKYAFEGKASYADITKIEKEIMEKNAKALIEIETELLNADPNRFKIRGFYELLSSSALEMFNLLQRTDLYPDKIEKYLDFVLNPTINNCSFCNFHPDPKPLYSPIVDKKQQVFEQITPKTDIVVIEPSSSIVFNDYEIGNTYKTKIRLRNVSHRIQTFHFVIFRKQCPYRITMLTEGRQLAPGLCSELEVIFEPKIYKSYDESINFKTNNGNDVILRVQNQRASPKLGCYIYSWNTLSVFKQIILGVSHRRREALNFTIDCGTCLLGKICVVAVIMRNGGPKGRFFLTTETEWNFAEINWHDERVDELQVGCFSITPSYFEIDTHEIAQIFITFAPETDGFFTENFILVCDNNAHQEIEIIGDCIYFAKSALQAKLVPDEKKVLKKASIQGPDYKLFDTFLIRVHNTSGVHYEYYWTMQIKELEEDEQQGTQAEPAWLNIKNKSAEIPKYGNTDFQVTVEPDPDTEDGHYFAVLGLYLKNIPTVSIWCGNEDCDCDDSESLISAECLKHSNSSFDIGGSECDGIECDCGQPQETLTNVLVCEIKIAFVIETESEASDTSILPSVESFDRCSEACMKPNPKIKVVFNQTFYNFGVIPKGVAICKSIIIENLTTKPVDWKINEFRCNTNDVCQMFLFTKNLNKSFGRLYKKRKLTYKINSEACEKCIGVLTLFVKNAFGLYVYNSLAFIIYEVAEIFVRITTETHMLPLLCPKEVFYVGMPNSYTICLHNEGASISCFYFLKPKGFDQSKIKINFVPRSGIIYPGQSIDVTVHLCALERSILDELYIPCFVGDMKSTLVLRILCAVDGISVNVHLPNGINNDLQAFIWPPRTELDLNWDTIRRGAEDEGEVEIIPWVKPPKEHPDSLIGLDAVAINYPTVKIGKFPIKTAVTCSFYIENLTPLVESFAVEATNYSPLQPCLNNPLIKCKLAKIETMWNKECAEGYGITMEPSPNCGHLPANAKIKVDVCIYANTWGKYLEEVIVEIDDLTPFCFNLIVEVYGIPLEFPFAANTILDGPLLRFGMLVYSSGSYTRSLRIANISAVDLFITWHIFNASNQVDTPSDNFNFVFDIFGRDSNIDRFSAHLTPKSFGEESTPQSVVSIEPREMLIARNTTEMMQISINTDCFDVENVETNLKYNLLAYIHIRDEDKWKENYFRRAAGSKIEQLCLTVLAQLEMPILMVDLHQEDMIFDVFVNDLYFQPKCESNTSLVLRNGDKSTIYFKLEAEKPFKLSKNDDLLVENGWYVLPEGQVSEMNITYQFTQEAIHQYGEFIYKNANGTLKETIDSYTSVIQKSLNIIQKGMPKRSVPFVVNLHYPHFDVTPAYVKFGRCLTFDTAKTVLTVFNRTKSVVFFEIFKSTQEDTFTVVPNTGLIAPSTGTNSNFIDVCVYFTPKEPCLYEETFRIASNISHYYKDIPVQGYGSNNEKFHID